MSICCLSLRASAKAQAVAQDCAVEHVGIRPGEKLHEMLISEDEARQTLELDDMFVVQPAHPWWGDIWKEGRRLPEGFCYSSDNNRELLDVDSLRALVKDLA